MIDLKNKYLALQFYGGFIIRLVKLNCLNQDVFISINLEHFIVLLYAVVTSEKNHRF